MENSYSAVNAAWPADLPPITRDEAHRAARKLARHFGGRPRREPRKCWVARTPPFNGIMRGWRRLVHDVSHSTFRVIWPHGTDHGGKHAELERQMVEYVLAKGWLAGTLRPTPKPEGRPTPGDKLARVHAAIRRWETKRKRAETALKKLRLKARRYERVIE